MTRDEAVRCVKLLDLREHAVTLRGLARPAGNEVSEDARIAAIVALSQWGDAESRSAFEEAAASSSPRLQRAGRAALEALKKRGEAVQPF